MALRGYKALVKAQSSAVAMTAEPTTMSGTNTIYTITNAAKRTIDINTPLVVKDGGVATTEAYTVDWLSGIITFQTAVVRTITVDGAYVILSSVVEAKQFSKTVTREALDVTRFQQAERVYEAGLLSGTATLTENYLVASTFYATLISGNYLVIEFYPNDDLTPDRFYALLTSRDINAPVEGIIEQNLSFQITKQMK